MSSPEPLTPQASHSLHVLRSVLNQSVSRGERIIDQARCVAASLAMISVIVTDWSLIWSGGTRPRFTLSGLGLGILLSLWSLQEKQVRSTGRLVVSILTDALLVSVALLPTVIWTRPSYPGQILMPGIHFYGLAIVLAGLRLERRLVWLAIVLNVSLVLGFLSLDVALNGPAPMRQPGDVTLNVVLFVMYAVLGLGVASRTRNLVKDGASSVLAAERARQALGVYVSESIADEVLGQAVLQPGGAQREVVVLFTDLRGFTTYAEDLDPSRLVDELNRYLDAMVTVIQQEGGVVDKYIGDAIMAVFGLPIAKPDDTQRAVRCAMRLQEALDKHNAERTQDGLIPLRQGLGLHRGTVVAGNIGSADRLQYTVIGNTVNLASRLESATKSEGVAVLISQDVVDDLPADARVSLRQHGTLSLRGAAQSVQVWTLDDGEPPVVDAVQADQTGDMTNT